MAARRQHGLALAALVMAFGCSQERPSPEPEAAPQRIVSLAPSLTETLFALGLGDRVVGVTRYCDHPPAAREVPVVGGHLDPNFEAIVALEPDLVVAIPSSHESSSRLESLGLHVVEVDQSDVPSILGSMAILGEACGVADRGRDLRDEIEQRIATIELKVAGSLRPRVVVVIGHQSEGSAVRSVWVAGRESFYSEVVRLAGGVNAVDGGTARYPELGREGLASIDPDVVLDLVAGVEDRALDLVELRRSWSKLTELRAAREGRVHVLVGDHMVVPGPRLPEMVEEVARALQPDLDWGGP
jgi:iron complex transport system substrate-binding protein